MRGKERERERHLGRVERGKGEIRFQTYNKKSNCFGVTYDVETLLILVKNLERL